MTENTTTQNLWDTAKAVLRGKFTNIYIHTYIYIYIYPAYIHIHRITMYPNLNSRENMVPKLGKSSSLKLRE